MTVMTAIRKVEKILATILCIWLVALLAIAIVYKGRRLYTDYVHMQQEVAQEEMAEPKEK